MTIDLDSLDAYRDACSGQPYRALVELHAVRHDPAELAAQIRAVRGAFRVDARRPAERLYNAWNRDGQHPEVLDLDCGVALDRVVADARRRLPDGAGDAALKRAFRLVTLGLALTASLFPAARRRMEVSTARELRAGPAGEEG